MGSANPFLFELDEYQRNTDLLPAYIEQAVNYIVTMRGKSYEWAKEFVLRNMAPGGKAELKDREVFYLARGKNGDRQQRTGTLLEYWKYVREHNLIMVPTMTVYLNPSQRRSYLAEYIDINIKKRKHHKKLMFKAKQAGDKQRENFEDNNQSTCKYKNNSLSGAHSSPFTPLFNKSSHSTLTSTCRISTSYANASNECFLSGNRHYWNPNVTLGHMNTVAVYTDFEALKLAMDAYSLYYPTADDVVSCVRYSTDLYWVNNQAMAEITEFATKMTPLQRAAFVYSGDLYHLAKHNDAFVRQFLDVLSSRPEGYVNDLEQANDVIDKTDGDILNMACLICSQMMAKRGLADIYKEKDVVTYGTVAFTALHIGQTLKDYLPLIRGLWRPSVLPPSIAVLPSIIRRAVVTSDTDSTIFTNQHWTMWFTGGELFTPKTYDIGYTTTYLASQLVKHKLALMSANIGAAKEHIHKISMKNEYYFPVFSLTNQAKHYFAYKYAQEGVILKELEPEIKGVNLRDSTVSAVVMKRARKYMTDTMDTVMERGKLTMDEVLGPVAAVERTIFNDVSAGGFSFMKGVQVKDTESYVQKEEAPVYQYHLMWEEVFSPKYGAAPPPPYNGVKVSVELPTRQHLQRWIARIKDRELAARMEAWLVRNNKTAMSMFVLPVMNLQSSGIPVEVLDAIDDRKLVYGTMTSFYLVLESLGIFMKNDNYTRLVSDNYTPIGQYQL